MLFIIAKIVLFVEKKKTNEGKETFCRSSRSYNFNAFWHDHVTVFRSLFFSLFLQQSNFVCFSLSYGE